MTSYSKPAQIKDTVEPYDFCEAELVVGLVCAVGTDYTPIRDALVKIVGQFGCDARVVRISTLIPKLTDAELRKEPEIDRINSLMDAGNKGCRESGRKDLWALAAIAEINAARQQEILSEKLRVRKPLPRTAHIVLTLKRPEEIATLRKVYGDGFFLVGVFATEKERLDHLLNLDVPKQSAKDLIKRDSEESDPYGQQTRATYHLADVFVQVMNDNYRQELERFFDLVFGDPFITPTQREHAMFLAYASSLRSASLARQVGAAIASRAGDILSLGCNDVPKPGGGLYWPGPHDRRDHVLGYDTNDRQRAKLTESLLNCLPQATKLEAGDELRRRFRKVLDITEYPSRKTEVSHALMEAWSWLEREGFLVRDANQTSSPWFFLSRRAQSFKSREDLASYRRASILPKGQIHPLVAAKVYPAFLRGEYDTAVFQAFREVEIAVREAGTFSAETVGVDLMRQALRPQNRPEKPLVRPRSSD